MDRRVRLSINPFLFKTLSRTWPLLLLPYLFYVGHVTISSARVQWGRVRSQQNSERQPATPGVDGQPGPHVHEIDALKKQFDKEKVFSWPVVWTRGAKLNTTSAPREMRSTASPNITPGSGFARVTPIVKAQKQSSRILAVGWFTNEQLTRSTMQLADFLSLAVVAKRDAVLPLAIGNHLLSMQESRNVPHQFRRGLKPEILSEYFDLENIKQTMLTEGGSHLISARQARSQCAGNWSIVYLVSNYLYLEPMCQFQPDLLRTERAMMKRLQSTEHSEDTVDNNCTWVEKCLDPKLLSLGPFRNTVCVGFTKNRWTMESLVSQLEVFKSSECLLLPFWLGAGRHGIVETSHSTPNVALAAFKTSTHLRQLSQRLLHVGDLGSNYTAVHVRMEHLLEDYEMIKARGKMQTVGLEQFTLRCFHALLKFLKDSLHNNSGLVVSFDHHSESHTVNEKVQEFRQNLLRELRAILLRVTTVDELVEKYSSLADQDVLGNPGMRSLIDTELLVGGHRLVVIGGGTFQYKLYTEHVSRHPDYVKDPRTFAICTYGTHEIYNLKSYRELK